jgi:hypothetical protein
MEDYCALGVKTIYKADVALNFNSFNGCMYYPEINY